jgi:hypothetical protein
MRFREIGDLTVEAEARDFFEAAMTASFWKKV